MFIRSRTIVCSESSGSVWELTKNSDFCSGSWVIEHGTVHAVAPGSDLLNPYSQIPLWLSQENNTLSEVVVAATPVQVPADFKAVKGKTNVLC